jgi:hypothetical protein
MNANEFRFGFRALGREAERKETVWQSAFKAHVEADPRAMTAGECYLSHFVFSDEFRTHLATTGSTAGYTGPTWLQWLVFDIDVEGDILEALRQARRLAAWLVDRFKLEPDDLMFFYSGSKGFHVSIPSSLWGGTPAANFHDYARRFAETLAINAVVKIDSGVYARVNLLRAPNSKHRKTGRYKVQLRYDELLNLKPEAILEIAAEPREGWIPEPVPINSEAAECWREIVKLVDDEHSATTERRSSNGDAKLNPTTRAVLVEGSLVGDRHRELFSSAANLAEFGSVEELAIALLMPCGLNSGLTRSDVQRQIECGLKHGGRSHET